MLEGVAASLLTHTRPVAAFHDCPVLPRLSSHLNCEQPRGATTKGISPSLPEKREKRRRRRRVARKDERKERKRAKKVKVHLQIGSKGGTCLPLGRERRGKIIARPLTSRSGRDLLHSCIKGFFAQTWLCHLPYFVTTSARSHAATRRPSTLDLRCVQSADSQCTSCAVEHGQPAATSV